MLLAFFINMAMGALASVLLYAIDPTTRGMVKALNEEKPSVRFLVLTRSFLTAHWILLFDYLIGLVDDDEDDDDGDYATNTPT